MSFFSQIFVKKISRNTKHLSTSSQPCEELVKTITKAHNKTGLHGCAVCHQEKNLHENAEVYNTE